MAHHPDDRSAGRPAPAASPRAISPLDIQQKEFRTSRFSGYRMRDVDEFLDQLTDMVSSLLEENGRLRAQVGAEPMVGSPDLDDVARQADEIIQRARDEAARIVAEARDRSAISAGGPAAGAASPAEAAAVSAFLMREREFLQSLAGLVQGHAEGVKAMAKRARAAAPATEVARPEPVLDPPELAVEQPGPRARGAEPDEVDQPRPDVDRTQALPAEEPIRLDEPQPAGRKAADRGDEGDPALKELFWGEEG
jgi:DivIVA domain-containing protein